MAKKVIDSVPASVLGMLADLNLKVRDRKITPRELELFLKRKNPFVKEDDILAVWRDFYKRVLGMEVDFSDLVIPKPKPGYDRLIIIAQGLTIRQALAACAARFAVSSYLGDDPDKAVPKNDRTPASASYAIWVRDRREADEELKNLSANDLAERHIPGITLLERLVYELKYHDETGEHLDVQNITLCTGSRDSGGLVPYVYWSGDYLRVYWYGTGDADDDLRSRSVVS